MLNVPNREHGVRLSQLVDEYAHGHPTEVDAAGGLVLLHDWRSFYTYDPALRSFYLERMMQRRSYKVKHIAVVARVHGFVQMAVRTIGLVTLRTLGTGIAVVEDPQPVLDEFGLEPILLP